MLDSMTPLTTGIVAAIVLAAVVAVIACFVVAARREARTPVAKLPSGADAALWSIVEAVPDPRNHLALTRDLSGEVHITTSDREAVAALFADEPRVQRVPPAPAPAPDATPSPERAPEPLWEPVLASPSDDDRRPSPSHEGREDLTLSGQLFFSGQPELNRF